MMKSIFDRFVKRHENNKELTEEQQKAVLNQILTGIQSTGQQKEVYRIRVDKAVARAQKAIKANDAMGKQIAMRELKANYGFFRYMSFMQDAFKAMESHIKIQTATRDFAEMVEGFSRIHIQDKPVNFDKLLGKALKNFQPMDAAGLDKMLNGLVGYTTSETETNNAEDAFLEALVSGQATLDTPYSSTVAQTIVQPQSAASEGSTSATADQDMMALLNQMLEGLKD